MEFAVDRYDRWKAPAEDGQALIWPPPEKLLDQTLYNQRLLSGAHSARVQNVPLSELRQRMRAWLGCEDAKQPLIATGHQTELHHAGVWVKNALINSVASKLGGLAYHFAVDTDAPKHLLLRWPGGSLPLTDDSNAVAWAGLLDSPSPSHIQRVADDFEAAAHDWPFVPMAPAFLASLRRLAPESLDLPSALTHAVHELDWKLGLRHHAMIVSPICVSEPYLVFVHHLLARADAFSADYNAALAEHRTRNKIRSVGRPMPDLQCQPDGCEVPFWHDSLADGLRTRAAVARRDNGFVLRSSSGSEFLFEPSADGWDAAARLAKWLRQNSVRLSPRALTLTAVLRLLGADQFVHGIGGGQYDQVLDLLIARHFGVEPPRFSVTTATLYFPTAAGEPRVCLPCVRDEGRRLKHDILGQEKMEIVGAIAQLPRRSARRAELFFAMHGKLAQAFDRPELRSWQEKMSAAEQRAKEERVLFDRELFYAVQPINRLEMMIDYYARAFA